MAQEPSTLIHNHPCNLPSRCLPKNTILLFYVKKQCPTALETAQNTITWRVLIKRADCSYKINSGSRVLTYNSTSPSLLEIVHPPKKSDDNRQIG